MAAPQTQITGAQVAIQTETNSFLALEDATFVRTATLLNVTGLGDENFRKVETDMKGYTLDANGVHVIGTTRITGCPTVYAEDNLDSIADEQVGWVQSATLQYNMDPIPVNDCSAGTWMTYLPGERAWTCTLVYSHWDYNDSVGHIGTDIGQKNIIDAWEGGTSIDIKIVVGSMSFFGQGYVTNLSRSHPRTGVVTTTATIELNAEGTGPVTQPMVITGTAETALANVLTDITTANNSAATAIVVEGNDTGSESYSGSSYCTALTLGWTTNANSTMSASFTGTGALSRGTS